MIQVCERGIVTSGEPGSNRAVATFPGIASLSDGTVLATYRVGPTKDSDDETIEIRRSQDAGRTWSDPVQPFLCAVEGRRGSLKVAYVTQMEGAHLVAAALWVDREAFPGKPLFNAETEGCLPMRVLLAHSWDVGETWTPWRAVPLPHEIGPPSLTSPLLYLPSGKWALSIETNKDYLDKSQWLQRVVYVYSEDGGQSWSEPLTVSQDSDGRIFNWDQRAGIAADGRLVTFSWTYDRTTNRYLNIQRRLSPDEGKTWSQPEDLGFADQASHPAILPDGRLVLAWVDRFHTRTIRARCASAIDGFFDPATEVVLYKHAALSGHVPAADTGEMLSEMGLWSFGLPFAEALPNGKVLVTYYAGSLSCMSIYSARLSV
jgi:hypothetical protein